MTLNLAATLFATSLAIAAAAVTPTPNTLTDIPIASLADTIQAAVDSVRRFVGKLWQD